MANNSRGITEEQSKQNANLVAEEIDTMGQESEAKAVKWVQEIENNRQKEEMYELSKNEEKLSDKRKHKKNPYYESLLKMAKDELEQYDIPVGYNTDILLKENGKIVFGLQKVGFRWYAKGMNISGEPKYDINCVQRMVVQMMLSIDELYEQHENHQTKEGIQLPTKSKFSL
jgi:hypothetical protein